MYLLGTIGSLLYSTGGRYDRPINKRLFLVYCYPFSSRPEVIYGVMDENSLICFKRHKKKGILHVCSRLLSQLSGTLKNSLSSTRTFLIGCNGVYVWHTKMIPMLLEENYHCLIRE